MLAENNLSYQYRGTTHIGKTGLESFYETQLHGLPGYQEVERDAAGNIIRVIKSQPAKTGQTLRLAMDIRLQQEADRLMAGKRGAMVAIDPQTGGVLAFVSKPGFDPNLFIDGIDGETWNKLNTDWQRPMINRVTQGLYPQVPHSSRLWAWLCWKAAKSRNIPWCQHQGRGAFQGLHICSAIRCAVGMVQRI